MSELAAIYSVLTEIRDRLSVLERRSRNPCTLSRSDRAALSRLLPAIGGVFGEDLFVAAEIAESLTPAIRVARGALNVKQLGKLLKRADDIVVDGYVASHEGTEAGANLWRVRAVPDFPKL